MSVTTQARLTCPECGSTQKVDMPTDACQFFYECQACHSVLKPERGDCCVFCSYADTRCPPEQEKAIAQ